MSWELMLILGFTGLIFGVTGLALTVILIGQRLRRLADGSETAKE